MQHHYVDSDHCTIPIIPIKRLKLCLWSDYGAQVEKITRWRHSGSVCAIGDILVPELRTTCNKSIALCVGVTPSPYLGGGEGMSSFGAGPDTTFLIKASVNVISDVIQ